MKILYMIGNAVFHSYEDGESWAKDMIKERPDGIVTMKKVSVEDNYNPQVSFVKQECKVVGNFYFNATSFK